MIVTLAFYIKGQNFSGQLYQDVFTEGQQVGLEKGLQKGLQKGLHAGEVKIILRQLNRQFGSLSPKTITDIQKLSSDQLEALADKVFDFKTQNDLDAWLGQI